MRTCEHPGCEREHKGKGFCSMHYGRWKRGSPPMDASERGSRKCSVEGCERKYYGNGFCSSHRARWLRNASLTAPLLRREKIPVGTIHRDSQGYSRIKLAGGKQGWTSLSRHLMAKHLGRPLLKHEDVHHINGIRDDNRTENLELWTSSHPRGQRVADKLIWAREILETYKGQLHLFE